VCAPGSKHIEAFHRAGDRIRHDLSGEMRDINAVARIALRIEYVLGDAAHLWHAVKGHTDGSAPGVIDLDSFQLRIEPEHQWLVVTFDESRIIAKVVDTSTEQQALVRTQAEVLENEIGIAYGEVHRIDAGHLVISQWFGRNDETIDREHDAAKARFYEVVRVSCYDNVLGSDRAILCDDGWF